MLSLSWRSEIHGGRREGRYTFIKSLLRAATTTPAPNSNLKRQSLVATGQNYFDRSAGFTYLLLVIFFSFFFFKDITYTILYFHKYPKLARQFQPSHRFPQSQNTDHSLPHFRILQHGETGFSQKWFKLLHSSKCHSGQVMKRHRQIPMDSCSSAFLQLPSGLHKHRSLILAPKWPCCLLESLLCQGSLTT